MLSNGNQLCRFQNGGGGPYTTPGVDGGAIALSQIAGTLDGAPGL